MPEGPEIHRAAKRIDKAIAGRPATLVYFGLERLKEHEQRLMGSTCEAVVARGKAMLTRFSNGLTVYSHNQLYGKWFVKDADAFPTTRRQLRFRVQTERKNALLYSASSIEVLATEDELQHPYLQRLGPDLLAPEHDEASVYKHINSGRFDRRKLSALLLDQKFLAGVGNYLRSEILFHARIGPRKTIAGLTDNATLRLARESLRVARQSLAHNGVTNDLPRAQALKKDGVPRRDYRHSVFRRHGKPCYTCGNEIIGDTIDGRHLSFCPECQG